MTTHRCPRCSHHFEVPRTLAPALAKAGLALSYPTLFAAGLAAVGTGGFVAIFMPLIALSAMGVMSVLSRAADPEIHCPECGAYANGAVVRAERALRPSPLGEVATERLG